MNGAITWRLGGGEIRIAGTPPEYSVSGPRGTSRNVGGGGTKGRRLTTSTP
jgi:hypothetical protein